MLGGVRDGSMVAGGGRAGAGSGQKVGSAGESAW